MVQDISQLTDRLVEEIRAHVQDETILNAFRSVPRHEFIETFFDGTYKNGKQEWQCVHPTDPQWLDEVYKNRPLVTSLDCNRPNVSSSQPDIMAKMLQSLKLQRGMRVLEIGTGTGYNAAILAMLVGHENVVSIDINAALLKFAQERLARTVGAGVTLLHADGRNLKSCQEFDAILIAASHDRIEPSWIRALGPGGRLILNWSKSFSKVFLEAEKVDCGLVGQVAQYSGDFMDLHDGHGAKRETLPYHAMLELATLDFRAQLVEDFDFGFFLQIHMPSLTSHRYRKTSSGGVSYSVKGDANRVVHFSSTAVTGDASLWEEIRRLYNKFKELKSPKRKKFSFSVSKEGCMVFSYDNHVIGMVDPS